MTLDLTASSLHVTRSTTIKLLKNKFVLQSGDFKALRELVKDLGQIIEGQGNTKPATPNKGKGPDHHETPRGPQLGPAISFATGTTGGKAPPKREDHRGWCAIDNGPSGYDLGTALGTSDEGPLHTP
ncbi:unnamed protein product [Rhizoctonia solani]|uniref:Uncharacterized protein n=1 Tax=Rhizoctonia solani TaxID=456999 RepID=A0A8H3C0U7_9AGAM|nr:unnamed protein product [Rhizoctonia solani]